jgi:hypothetical protein
MKTWTNVCASRHVHAAATVRGLWLLAHAPTGNSVRALLSQQGSSGHNNFCSLVASTPNLDKESTFPASHSRRRCRTCGWDDEMRKTNCNNLSIGQRGQRLKNSAGFMFPETFVIRRLPVPDRGQTGLGSLNVLVSLYCSRSTAGPVLEQPSPSRPCV